MAFLAKYKWFIIVAVIALLGYLWYRHNKTKAQQDADDVKAAAEKAIADLSADGQSAPAQTPSKPTPATA